MYTELKAKVYNIYSNFWYVTLISKLIYKYISITIVQSYTRKYHEFVAVCIVTSVQTMPTATNE